MEWILMKVNGVELKAVKYEIGHEGERLAQLSVYYKGKKVGTYEECDYGGGAILEVPNNVIKVLSDLYTEHFGDSVTKMFNDKELATLLIPTLLQLKDMEDIYKKKQKNCDYEITLFVGAGVDEDGFQRLVAYTERSSIFTYEDVRHLFPGKMFEVGPYLDACWVYEFAGLESFTMENTKSRIVDVIKKP